MASRPPDPRPFLVTFPYLLHNFPVLEKAAAGRGLLSVDPERDGIVRRVPIVILAGGEIVPSLSLETLRVALGAPAIRVVTNPVANAGLEGVQQSRLASRYRPIRAVESGCISAPMNVTSMSPPKMCSRERSRPIGLRASSFWSELPRWGCSTTRRPRWIGRCRGWKYTRS